MPKLSLKEQRTKVLTLLILIVFPAILIYYTAKGGSNYALLSFVIIILSMVPFLMLFEMKKPRAREWIPLAVMAAIAAVGRAAFAMIPQFKPVSAIVIITALCFGPEAGFLTGAVSALASNLFFGQGPWTPWQMFSWGIIGFLAGVLNKAGLLKHKWQLLTFGFISGYLFGWIMNIWDGIGFLSEFTWEGYLSLCVASLPTDFIHALATVVFLWLLSDSWCRKLTRIKTKFGILEE